MKIQEVTSNATTADKNEKQYVTQIIQLQSFKKYLSLTLVFM